ncbi:MAG TPA: alkaline phosphatase family protein [Candidatus Baltobacteraceae bacterium]|jgi:phospholipase C
MTTVRWCALAALVAFTGGCASAPFVPVQPSAANGARSPAAPPKKIQHVLILIQENRSFDNFFATFPRAEGTMQGRLRTGTTVTTVPLTKAGLLAAADVPHNYNSYRIDYDGGKMDGFGIVASNYGKPQLAPYQYVDPKQIAVYWTLAKRYVLADHMFMTAGSDSTIAHQDLIAGGTQINTNDAIVDSPIGGGPPGCDASKNTITSLVTRAGAFLKYGGPFPCYSYATLRDLLDRKHVSWRYYHSTPYDPWNPFEAIRAVRYGDEWGTKVVDPQTKLFGDIKNQKLPSVSWVIPTGDYSDHPGIPHDYGPDWIGSIVNAIGESSYWQSTAIFIIWDDWGGLYDHVPPRQFDFGQLGFRVPAIVVSPYARSGYVAHTQYEFGSILRFVEDNWQLGRLGTSDVRAASVGDVFDFSQQPRRYVPVRVTHPPSFFIALPPSNLPLDTE